MRDEGVGLRAREWRTAYSGGEGEEDEAVGLRRAEGISRRQARGSVVVHVRCGRVVLGLGAGCDESRVGQEGREA